MDGAEGSVIGSVAVGVVVQLAIALLMFAWGRWVARRHGTAGWRRAAWLPIAGLVLAIVGMALTAVLLVGSFGAIANVDPSQKAAMLAQGISEAMNTTALFAGSSALLHVASFVTSAIGTLKRPR